MTYNAHYLALSIGSVNLEDEIMFKKLKRKKGKNGRYKKNIIAPCR